ncbi:MAG: hypothetical protein CSA24_03040 [Deltaproteobacteria bacterium]|nr:MAG: hypothetical protein CSA24_03040 [Deltaproteobacteria bacterium]
MRHYALGLSIASLLFVVACDKAATSPEAGRPAVVAAPAEAAASVTKPDAVKAGEPGVGALGDDHAGGGCDGDCGGKEHPKGGAHVEGGCDDPKGTQLDNDNARTITRADGVKVTHVGDDFGQAEVVKVSELIANPDAYAGKTVAVTGDVSAMCGHKRSWFAVAAEDKSGNYVRVKTTPVFLVPAGSIGKSAKAEGKVEVVEVEAKHARHIAEEHKLGDPSAIKGNVKQVVIRATGAEFM